MYRLKAVISNSPSPLEEAILEGDVILDFEVTDKDPDTVLNTLEPQVYALRGDRDVALEIAVYDQSGGTILRGTAKKGFSGIAIL